jgi:threonine aldolase
MQHFDSDYMEGACPEILKRLVETNLEKTPGYGTDPYSEQAKKKIRKACGRPDAEIFFLIGGTQTNETVITSLLRPYEGVIAAETGHVNTHEAGAIEHGGHKVLTVKPENGKVTAGSVRALYEKFENDANHEHEVRPGMVYLSHPTEYGTLYTKAELKELHDVCREYGMFLFLDGARLGYGLTAPGTDVFLPDIAALTDVFYIGGTKVGALFGEAVVFPTPGLIPHFFTLTKQHGALLAKGRITGLQFDTLFTDDLYFRISRHAVDMAMKIRKGLESRGYRIYIDSPTNQQFTVVTKKKAEELSKNVTYGFMEELDEEHIVIRFCTSWATREEDVDELLKLL